MSLWSAAALLYSCIVVVPTVALADAAEKLGICQTDETDVKERVAACDAVIGDLNEPAALRAEALLNRGIVKEEDGDLDGAVADFTAALALNPDYPALYEHRGLVMARLGQGRAALDDLATAIRLDPENAELHASRATVYVLLGDDRRALDDLAVAIRIAPDDADHYARRGMIFLRLGSHAKAKADARKALELEPDHELATQTLAELRKQN
jgi:tetratricopeptide (TPR) repeat protein